MDRRPPTAVRGSRLAVAVVQDGKTVLSQGFGLRDVHAERAVTPDTAFAIASATKAFTASAVAALVDDGLLDWDRPVRLDIGNFQLADHVATECITPRDLLCHRSGLPRHDHVWYRTEGLTRADIVERLRYLQPNKTFRSTWQYNNLMYVVAGYLCELATGESWESAVRARLLEPMGMRQTGFSYADSASGTALPYVKRADQIVQIPYLVRPDVCGPAGSIYSTLADLTAWMRMNLDGGRLGDARILSEQAIRQLHAPHMVMPEERVFEEVSNHSYGLGWFIGTYRGHRYVHHGGNTDGFTSLVAMLPDDKIGVVILANLGTTPIREAIAYHTFDELLGLDPAPWGERLKSRLDAALGGAKEAKRRVARVAGTSPSHPLEDYAGSYEHPAYGRFDIEHADGKLLPRFRSHGIECVHRHYDVFDLEYEEFEDAQLTATFSTATDGTVASVSLPLEPFADPIVFRRLPDVVPAEVCQRLSGVYAMGPVEARVELAPPDKLTIRLPGGGAYALRPRTGLTFTVDGVQEVSATFLVGDDGDPIELLLQPVGVFHPKES